jgi:hypothetical protein
MEVRLSALSSVPLYPPGRFQVLISVRDLIGVRAVGLEGLEQLKNLMMPS